jgi:hypothetical protein
MGVPRPLHPDLLSSATLLDSSSITRFTPIILSLDVDAVVVPAVLSERYLLPRPRITFGCVSRSDTDATCLLITQSVASWLSRLGDLPRLFEQRYTSAVSNSLKNAMVLISVYVKSRRSVSCLILVRPNHHLPSLGWRSTRPLELCRTYSVAYPVRRSQPVAQKGFLYPPLQRHHVLVEWYQHILDKLPPKRLVLKAKVVLRRRA